MKIQKQHSNDPSENGGDESFQKDSPKEKIKFFGSADILYSKETKTKKKSVGPSQFGIHLQKAGNKFLRKESDRIQSKPENIKDYLKQKSFAPIKEEFKT